MTRKINNLEDIKYYGDPVSLDWPKEKLEAFILMLARRCEASEASFREYVDFKESIKRED